jgi:hypothetical protein
MLVETRLVAPWLATLLGIAGCTINDPPVGAGPIQLSPAVQAGLAQYRQERVPGHFAVSLEGRHYAYNYCPEANCRRGEKLRAIEHCQTLSGGQACKVYAAYGQVVWWNAAPGG